MIPTGMETLALHAPVLVRLADSRDHEYTARIADFDVDEIVISAPAGGSAALLASAAREVDIAWLSRRGRYEQRCIVVEHSVAVQVGQRQWRLRPVRRPVLIQRRRHIRVSAKLPVRVVIGSQATAGVTIDISEGGFRVRLPRQDLPDLAHATVHATMGAARVAVSGYVVRAIDALPNHTDAVIAFDAAGTDADAIRRLVLNAKLQSKTTRTASARSPRSR
jgi:PilZ domain